MEKYKILRMTSDSAEWDSIVKSSEIPDTIETEEEKEKDLDEQN